MWLLEGPEAAQSACVFEATFSPRISSSTTLQRMPSWQERELDSKGILQERCMKATNERRGRQTSDRIMDRVSAGIKVALQRRRKEGHAENTSREQGHMQSLSELSTA